MSHPLTHRTLLLILPLLGGCSGEAPTAEEPVIRPVRYLELTLTPTVVERTFSGIARASQETRLSFQVGGRIQELPARVGDAVAAEQLIAALEPRDFEIRVREAEAGLQRTQAELRSAEADYARTRGLYENNPAARAELDTSRARAESAAAAVRSAQQQLALARRQLAYTRLTAPVRGSIAAVEAEVTENVTPGQTIAVLAAGGLSEVVVALPELLVASVYRADPVTVRFDALPERSFSGVVTEVGVASTGSATTFPLTVQLQEVHSAIRSGMAAEVTLLFTDQNTPERIVVPSQAVSEDPGGRYVFVLEDAEAGLGYARRRAVEVGALTTRGLEVRAGLEPGERVITAGVSRISDGLKVRVLPQ